MKESITRFSWKTSLARPYIKTTLIAGFILTLCTLSTLPAFFDIIEKRNGIVLNDVVLQWLPILNLSVPIFVVIWSVASLMAVRCLQNPYTLGLFVWGFLFLTLSRIVTISIVPLNAPIGLIQLKDPLSNAFYRGPFITKDLFYSGHTSTQFLMLLCLQRKWEKALTLCSTIAIGVMVLVQHVHYTVDVVAAPFGAYLAYFLAKKVVDKGFGIG